MKRNNILGYILGILVGLIFSIPWILSVAFLNIFIGYLSILAVFGLILGYKIICKSFYNNKSSRLYLILSSTFIVLINMFLVLPICISLFTNGRINIESILKIYENKSMIFIFAINSVLGLLMTVIPALLIPIDYKKSENEDSIGQDILNKVEKVFAKHNAFTKETAVNKNLIKEDLYSICENKIANFWFIDSLKNFRIKNKKKNWYFVKKNKKFRFGIFFSILCLIAFTFIWNLSYSSLNLKYSIDDKLTDNVYDEIKEKVNYVEYKINDKFSMKLPEVMEKSNEQVTSSDGVDTYYYAYMTKDVLKSDLQMVLIYYYKGLAVDDYNLFKSYINETISQYNINYSGDIIVKGYNGFYFNLDSYSTSKITNSYFIPVGDDVLEIYTMMTREGYDEESQKISDDIIRNIKFSNN